ncbi:glycosyltransferase family 61 protein [Rhizobiales bacterium]|uniref:glycosyltransferase family 61 protein n=1 Tax=Hongsoonwoonella zoysiae TaxID=2821844 RepID=UPI0015614C5E|nr:glycosyltransferase family 61 protein [Hongsoonwoonella zoysiae]NRG18488.1 glycosyltransferase family 61 protein [Hongsoonwoonella zoysiae]
MNAWPSAEYSSFAQELYCSTRCLIPEPFNADLPDFLIHLREAWGGARDIAYVRRYRGDLAVDPRSGHVFAGRTLLRGSTDIERDRSSEPTPVFARHILRRGRTFGRIALAHHKFSSNYFHFWNNIAPKAAMLSLAGVPADVPIVVPKAAVEIPFFAKALELGVFGKHPIIIQGKREVIKASEVYVAKPFDVDRTAIDATFDGMGLERYPEGNRRIFLSRGPKSPNRRFFRNQSELDALLEEFEIEKIDPQELDLREQIDAFSQAGLLISAHGAGLTNLLFRRCSSTTVIELFNPNLQSLHYALIASTFGHDYFALQNLHAEGRNSVASSEVDIEALRNILTGIAEAAPPKRQMTPS